MSHPKILLVEDDANVVLLLSRHLQRAGYTVATATTLAAARGIHDWDLAILDRHLPDGDGLEFCGELRSAFPHRYLLVLTGDEDSMLEAFGRGADDYMSKPCNFDELTARVRAGARIVGLQQRLQELSITDGLTSLRNRRAFDEQLPIALEHARRYDRPLSLALIDIDHFKSVNDTFGHDVGDAILRAVAQLIGGGTRQTDYVARIGGEEFAVLLPETALFDGLQFAEKLRASIAASTINVGDHSHCVTVSIGLANVPHSQVGNAEELYRAADQALYRAKSRGRNCVEMERRRNREGERSARDRRGNEPSPAVFAR